MAQQAGGVFERLRARGEQVFGRLANELMGNERFVKALQGALRGKQMLDRAVGRALKTMNLPTRTEFGRAVARIEQLERELAELRRSVAATAKAAAGPGRRASRPKRAARE